MQPSVPVLIPTEFPNDETVFVTAIHVAAGDLVREGDILLELEFSKAVVEIESPAEGYVRLLCDVNQEVRVGAVVAEVHPTREAALGQAAAPPVQASAPVENEASAPVFSRAAEAELARQGRSPAEFAGRDFVRSADVVGRTAEPVPVAPATARPSRDARPPQGTEPWPMSPSKRIEADFLQAGQNLATSNFKATLPLPAAVLSAPNPKAAFAGLSSAVTPAVLRAVCGLLKKYPLLNALFHGQSILRHASVALGYALDLGKGLSVVNLGDLEGLENKAVTVKIMEAVKKYMGGTLGPADLVGSTFTVTDMSSLGVEYFVPLVGKNQSAILGVCAPDLAAGGLPVSLTFDHRVAEGRVAALFLNDLKSALAKEFSA
jgi:pyruvate/2-oxoglutarate dehydrogenase complex dihydrolipoamide acyltransferase (E2) component